LGLQGRVTAKAGWKDEKFGKGLLLMPEPREVHMGGEVALAPRRLSEFQLAHYSHTISEPARASRGVGKMAILSIEIKDLSSVIEAESHALASSVIESLVSSGWDIATPP
jgi:hypothetical protein